MAITVNISAQEILAEGAFVDGDKTKLDSLVNGDADAIHDNVASEIDGITEKTAPTSSDLMLI